MEEKDFSKGKKVLNDLREMRTVGELVDYIPMNIIQRIAFFILVIWLLTPIIVMVYGAFAVFPDDPYWITKLNQMNMMSINWYRILQQLGFLGCFMSLLVFLKSIYVNEEEMKGIKFYRNRLTVVSLFFMLVWSLLSFVFTANEIYALTNDLTETLIGGIFKREGILTYFALTGIFTCAYLVRSRHLVRWIIKINTLVASLQSILILLDIEGINKLFGLTEDSGVFLNINHAGYYLCMSAMCGTYLIISENQSRIRLIVHTIMFGLIVAALVINSSLGPYLASLCALISSLILTIWLNKRLLSRVVMVIAIFFLVTIIASLIDGSLLMALQIFGLELGKIAEGEIKPEMGSKRLELWQLGFKFIGERPLFGYGPVGLSYAYKEVLGSHNRPHNEFIEHAATIGIPGLIFYIIALFDYLRTFFVKRKKMESLGMGLMCIVIAYLVSSLLGVTMFHTSAFFFMFFGLSLGYFYNEDESS